MVLAAQERGGELLTRHRFARATVPAVARTGTGIWGVVVLAGLLGGSGCGRAMIELWPKQQHQRVVAVSEPLTVRGNFPGAVVMTADGRTVLGPAPLELAAQFNVTKSWKEQSLAGPILGTAVAFGLMSFGTYKVIDSFETYWLGLMFVELGDVMLGIGQVASISAANGTSRFNARPQKLPEEVHYQLRWPGFEPVNVSTTIPGASEVLGKRPTNVSFEQAVLYWEQSAGVEPVGEALFEIGTAYLTRAERLGDRAAAAKAKGYFERYLSSPAAARTNEARASLARASKVGQ